VRPEPEVTSLVGGNGSGKTALLVALSRLFGVTTSQRSVPRRDFHLSRDQTELDSGATLSIDVVLAFPELEAEDANETSAIPDFFLHMSASAPDAPLKARMRLQATGAWRHSNNSVTPGDDHTLAGRVTAIGASGKRGGMQRPRVIATDTRIFCPLIYF